MKKRMVAMVLVLMMMLSMIGCSSGGGASEGKEKAEGETYDVAVIVRLTDMYGAWLKVAYEAAEKDFPNLNITVMDHQSDNAKLVECMENAVQQQYDFIVVQTVLGNFEDSFKRAVDAGIPVVSINCYQDWVDQYAAQVYCDEYKLGLAIGERASEELPENAQVVILDGPAGLLLSEQRHDGIVDGLNTRDDITILDNQDANFEKDTAMDKTEDWIQAFNGEIDGVLAASDSEALGAVEAFKSSGIDLKDVHIYGIDGLIDACNAITNGEMSASTLQDATQYPALSLKLITDHINGDIDLFKDLDQTTFDPELIDSSNVKEQLEFYKEQGLVEE
ncbi:sugar ABC transporter substrate-binding protein [Mediterraneibacter massiliensis]|uniref:sugar ABC transporter substrate-binding protein n=1 Tax=Mediterraneibacter massiliensis TaxID=1720300 RepID=UPI0022E7AF49|nr:sugar ABC transporter substrate-binding protein [Mediterraneibacter massiliensis]